MFSIVIPLYNKEASIEHTIRSILKQTVADFELLVINDGSTDKSREIVAKIADDRIIIVDKPNGGISSARNSGILAAKNEYIAFVDADDYWMPDFLEVIKGLINEFPQAGCYATGYACKFNNSILNVFGVEKRGIVEDFFKQVYKGPIMHSSSVCIKKSTFENIGYFSPLIKRGEDYDMWARLAKKVPIAASPETKVYYMLDSENKAMSALHAPKMLWLYYIPSDTVYNKSQREYYTRFLHRQVLEYFVKGKWSWAWQIASHNKAVARWYTYFCLPRNIQIRQVNSWLKLIRKRMAGKRTSSVKISV